MREVIRMIVDNSYIIVTCIGGGWYSFSPTGNKYYSTHDEIKIQGFNKLVKTMQAYGVHVKQVRNSCMLSREHLQKIAQV